MEKEELSVYVNVVKLLEDVAQEDVDQNVVLRINANVNVDVVAVKYYNFLIKNYNMIHFELDFTDFYYQKYIQMLEDFGF